MSRMGRRWGLRGRRQRAVRSAVCSPRARAACCCAAARGADARPGPLERSAAPAPHPGGETLGGVKKKKKKSKKDKGDAAEEPGGDEAAAGGGGEGGAGGGEGGGGSKPDKKGAPGINVKGHSYEQEFDLEMKRLQVRGGGGRSVSIPALGFLWVKFCFLQHSASHVPRRHAAASRPPFPRPSTRRS